MGKTLDSSLAITPRRFLTQARAQAVKRGVDFDLSFDDLQIMLLRANGRCEITGVPFSEETWGAYRRPFRMSIDRKDSREPYSFGNCRLVCVAANLATNEWGEEVLMTMVRSMMGEAYDVQTYSGEDADEQACR